MNTKGLHGLICYYIRAYTILVDTKLILPPTSGCREININSPEHHTTNKIMT